jgi:dephospho-CoA kinase
MARFVVAVTGGIATGKSQVDALFLGLGVPVVDADQIAREIVLPGQPALAEIRARFGAGVLSGDGSVDRAALRELIFDAPEARRDLEAIMHPRIRLTMEVRCLAADAPYVIASIPLLAEVGSRAAYPWLHRVLVVDAPIAAQHKRLQRRDGIDDELAAKMIDAQASRRTRLALATDVICNDGPVDALAPPVMRLHQLFGQLADSDALRHR